MLADVRQVAEDAVKLADAPLWALSDEELTTCLRAAHHVEQVAAVMKARLVQQAESRGLLAAQGHRSTTGWLRSRLLLDAAPARELADRAVALRDHPDVAQAVLDGHSDIRQAAAITATVGAVTAGLADFDDLDPVAADDIVRRAEATLVEMAGRLTAVQLRRVGERILAYVAPPLAERAEEAAL